MSDAEFSAQWLVRVSSDEPVRTLYSLETASRLTAIHPDLLRYYCRIGLLGAARAPTAAEFVFDDHALYEVRRIDHYRRHHGVNLRALPLVWDLMRQVDRLHAELRFLRDRG